MRVHCHILSFCEGYNNKDLLIERFMNQSNACDFIDSVEVISTIDHPYMVEFYKEHGSFVSDNQRGFGYWLWKPFVVLKKLNDIPVGDVIIYADIGCELSPQGGAVFSDYMKLLNSQNIVCFNTGNGNQELCWTKKELIDYFNLPIFKTTEQQIAATFFVIKNNNFSKHFVAEWLRIACLNDYVYINDYLTIQQSLLFIEHRHDQSIFSMLIKKHNISPLTQLTEYPLSMYKKNSYVLIFPVHTLRTKNEFFNITSDLYVSSRSLFIRYILFLWEFNLYRIKGKFLRVFHRLFGKLFSVK